MRAPIHLTFGTAQLFPNARYLGPSGHWSAGLPRQGMAVYGVSNVNSIEKVSGSVVLGMHPAMAWSTEQHKVSAVESEHIVIRPRSDVVNVALLWSLVTTLALSSVSRPNFSALVAPDEAGKERLMDGGDTALPAVIVRATSRSSRASS